MLVRASDEGKKLTLIWESKATKATQALWRQRSIVVKAASTVFHYITHFRKKLFGCNFHFVITTIFISVKLWHGVLENTCFCSFRFERRMKLKLSICFFFAYYYGETTSNYYAAIHLKVVVSILKFEKTKASKSELSSLEHRKGKWFGWHIEVTCFTIQVWREAKFSFPP